MQERSLILLSRLKWILFWRLIIAILALGAVLIYQLPLKETLFSQPRFLAAYIILTIACFSNIIYLLLLRVAKQKLKEIAILQIALDILLTSSLAYCTGGSASIFVSVYFALILAANILISARAGLFFATLSTILLALITIIYSFSAAKNFKLPLLSPDYVKTTAQGFRFIFPYLFFFTLIIHFVAYSVGRLVTALNYERLLKTKILQDMISGIFVLSPAGKILYANPISQQMLGIKNLPQFSGLPHHPGIGPESGQAGVQKTNITLKEFLDKAIRLDADQKDKFLRFTHPFISQDFLKSNLDLPLVLKAIPTDNEEGLLLDIKASILKSDADRLAGVIIIMDNITLEQKADELSKQSEFLKSLQGMSMSIAHEIRNPLTSIRAAVQELSRQLKLDMSEEQTQLIKTVIKESERLNNLVYNFMDFAKERKPIIKKSNIVEIINEIIPLIRQTAPPEIEIKLDLPQNKLFCDIDTEQIKQVLYNIILNAMQSLLLNPSRNYAPMGLPKDACPVRDGLATHNQQRHNIISIKIYPSSNPFPQIPLQKKGVMVEITDTGKGIPPQNMERIFEPFFTTRPDGIGLGLSIAKRIIDNHQGNINVESKLDEGTKISIWLPQNNPEIS